MNELLQSFYGPNAGYVLDLYERYRQDPQSVDSATRAFFENWSPPVESVIAEPQTAPPAGTVAPAPAQVAHILAASALAHDIRSRGHLGAHLDPLGSEPPGDPA